MPDAAWVVAAERHLRIRRGSEALLVADRENAIVRESRRDGLGRGGESGPVDDVRHRLRILRTLVAALSGTLLNAATVLIGGLLGTALGDRLPARLRENVVRGVGLFTLAMGVKFAIDTTNLLYVLGAMVAGGIVGSLAGVDTRLNRLGEWLQRRFARGATNTVAEGFVTAAIIFCVGPLTFLGSIQNGLTQDPSLLMVKSVLDGFTAIALASTLRWGVLLPSPLPLV